MDFYVTSLILGFLGLAIMAFSGLSHGNHGGGGHHAAHGHDVGDISLGHGGHAAGHGPAVGGHVHVGGHAHAGPHVHAGHGAAHGQAVAHGHGAAQGHAGANGHGAAHGHAAQEQSFLHGAAGFGLSLLSPRVLFSVLIGLGLTGIVGREWLGGVFLALVAVAGGIVFEKALVSPVWNFFMRFASPPADTLEGKLFDTATAVTGFDASGSGVVSLEMNGELVQLLATLRPEDRAAGVRVRAGDALLIEDVDGQRNRCTVSWAGAGAPLPR